MTLSRQVPHAARIQEAFVNLQAVTSENWAVPFMIESSWPTTRLQLFAEASNNSKHLRGPLPEEPYTIGDRARTDASVTWPGTRLEPTRVRG